jgi:hypothetical protein
MDDEDLPLLERAPLLSSEAFRSIFRVSRESFAAILTALRSSRGIPEKGPDLEDKTSLLITLYRLSTHQSSKSISEVFNMPDTAIRATYLNTVARLCRLTEEYVRFPEIQQRSTLSAEFPGVVCALSYDFIQLNALAQPALENSFRQCEDQMEIGVYIQATTTLEGNICQFSCYPAGTRPLTKLSENRMWTHGEENPLMLGGQCALTDMNSRCTPWLICPYPAPSGTHACMEHFNDRLISVVNRTVRRELRRLKQRFRSLMDRSPFTEVSIFNVVNACVVMHNICVEQGDTRLFEEYEDDEPDEPDEEDTDELFVYSEGERYECSRAVVGNTITARALKKRAQYEEANIVSEHFPVPRQHQGNVEDPGLPIDKRQRLNPDGA